MNIVISDPKTGKAYPKKIESPSLFLNKKIGEEVKLDGIGLEGYVAKIKGGSDKQGFPMHPSVQGSMRKKIFISTGLGFKTKVKGQRKRVSVRGNTVSNEIEQLNLVVVKEGKKKLDELKQKTEKKEEKKSIKEEMIKKSLESVEKKEEKPKEKEEELVEEKKVEEKKKSVKETKEEKKEKVEVKEEKSEKNEEKKE